MGYEAEAGSMMSSGDLSLLSSVTADPAAAEEIWFPLVVVFWEDILLLFMFGPVEIILDEMPTPPSTSSWKKVLSSLQIFRQFSTCLR